MGISQTVIDTSFLLKLFLPENNSEKAHRLWSLWIDDAVQIVAPSLIIYEAGSVIRNKVYRKVLTEMEGNKIIEFIKQLDIVLVYNENLLEESWQISSELKTSSLYDCFYLALAKLLNAPLWTADKKLFETAHNCVPSLNLL